MTEAAIRQAIFDILSGIAGIGIVHNRERWSADWGKFIELFKDLATGRICGCEITRPTVSSERIDNISNQDIHQYVIKMYRVVNDAEASELIFEALIETTRDTFRQNLMLNGTCNETSAMSKTAGDHRFFGATLCHYAELSFTASVY